MTLTDTELLTYLGFTSTREQVIILALAKEQDLTIPQLFVAAMRLYQSPRVMLGQLVGPPNP